MSEILIRELTKEDITAVSELEIECFPTSYWPKDQIEYEFENNPISTQLVAVFEDKIVGYLDFMITFDSATINRLATSISMRNKGVATSLLNRMIDICKHQEEEVFWITLEVRISNANAISLYEKLGWERITVKKNYYSDGEDAFYLVRNM